MKYTVIGVHDGEPLFAHVDCDLIDAWTCAVRAVYGSDWPEDAEPSGYTGLCLAVLEGWHLELQGIYEPGEAYDNCASLVVSVRPWELAGVPSAR